MRLALKAKKVKEEKKEKENEGKRQRVGIQIQDEKQEEDDEEPPIIMEGNLQGLWYGSWYDKILLDRRLRFFVVMALVAIMTPCLVWIFVLQPEAEVQVIFHTCRHYDEFRIPCFEDRQSEDKCLQSHCCYNQETGECYHHLPSSYGLRFKDWIKEENMANEALAKALKEGMPLVPKQMRSPDNVNLMDAMFTIRRKGSLLQLQIRDKSELAPPQDDTEDPLPYNITLGEDFEVQVGRKNEKKQLLSTAMGPTLLGEAGRWDVVLQLPTNATVLGAHVDEATTSDAWLYPAPGRPVALPTLLAVEESGKATAVRLVASAPMRLKLTERNVSANLLQIRLLVPQPASLTIEMVAADTPAEVLRVLWETDSASKDKNDTQPVPDWALGFIICPASDADPTAKPDPDAACKRFKAFLEDPENAALPWDAHCVEQSLLWEQGTLSCLDETNWENIGERSLLAVLPNAIRDGEIFETVPPMMIAEDTNETYIGVYKDMDVRFPDWLSFDNHTVEWVTKRIRDALGEEGSQHLGGVALIDNWPLDEGPREPSSEVRIKELIARNFEELDTPSQIQLYSLWEGTLYGLTRHMDGNQHFNRHALVPAVQVRVAAEAVRQAAGGTQQILVLSDAAGPGVGQVAGITGARTHGADVPSWESLRAAAVAALSLTAAGSAPLAAGDPVCGGGTGFNPKNESHLELCERWYQQAATLPLMWATSHPPKGKFSELPAPTRARAAEAVRLRYELLPYLRQLLAGARVGGLPVARHLALEFPDNAAARAASANAPHAQWMLGAALLVAPAAAPKVVTVEVFLPLVKEGNWRLLYGGGEINTKNAAETYRNENNDTIGHLVSVKLESSRPILLIRPGYIIPLTTSASAANATSVLEALSGGLYLTASTSCTDDCSATGELLLSTADTKPLELHLIATSTSITLSWNGTMSGCTTSRLESEVINYNTTDGGAYTLQELSVYGVPTNTTSEETIRVRASDGTLLENVDSRLINGRLTLSSINQDLCLKDGITAEW